MRTGNGSSPRAPIGVLSAVVIDEARPDRLLLGVRRPSPLSPRHPGVLSTPTMRLSPDTFGALTGTCPTIPDAVGIHPVDGATLLIGRGGHTTTLASLVIEDLLIRKLGLAEAIVDGRWHARAYPRYLSLDEVGDPLGTQSCEWTAMLTYEVRVHCGVDAIPQATASYSRIVWVPAGKVPTALAHHDALLLDETLDAAEVCVQGLCVRVAAQMVLDAGVLAAGRTRG